MTDKAVRLKLSEILKSAQGKRTVRKFASDIGLSHVTLLTWLDCSVFPKQENLEKIAQICGKSLDELLLEIRGDQITDTESSKAEDLLPLTNKLSDAEAFKLANLLLERVRVAIADKL